MIDFVKPDNIVPATGGYSHGVTTDRLLFISGQTPQRPDGTVPEEPVGQFRQVWANITAVLAAAGLGVGDLVHLRTYLAGREHRTLNTAVRTEVLAGPTPALTVVICDLYEPGWVAEIEAVALVTRETA